MKAAIIQLLMSKGLEVPQRDYELLAERWEAVQLKKRGFDQVELKEYDIALRPITGGGGHYGRT